MNTLTRSSRNYYVICIHKVQTLFIYEPPGSALRRLRARPSIIPYWNTETSIGSSWLIYVICRLKSQYNRTNSHAHLCYYSKIQHNTIFPLFQNKPLNKILNIGAVIDYLVGVHSSKSCNFWKVLGKRRDQNGLQVCSALLIFKLNSVKFFIICAPI